jgi:hypothetical protein
MFFWCIVFFVGICWYGQHLKKTNPQQYEKGVEANKRLLRFGGEGLMALIKMWLK